MKDAEFSTTQLAMNGVLAIERKQSEYMEQNAKYAGSIFRKSMVK